VLIGGALFEESGNEGVAFVLDLTERKRAEEAIRELETNFARMNRVSMMGELAASLSHEITQPIASARNNARAAQNFLDRQPPDLAEVREALGCVVHDADRAGDLVDRIREHIRKAPPRKDHLILIQRSARDGAQRYHRGASAVTRLVDGISSPFAAIVQLRPPRTWF
jgi:C4-dicarboxylate-specific signal transduction histidine kinase